MYRTITQRTSILVGIVAGLLTLPAPVAAALTASAMLQGTVVKVQGTGASPGHSVYWEGMWGGFASATGAFAFFSVAVPADCIGDVTSDLAKIAVAIAGCTPEIFPATAQTTCWNSAGTVIPCAR